MYGDRSLYDYDRMYGDRLLHDCEHMYGDRSLHDCIYTVIVYFMIVSVCTANACTMISLKICDSRNWLITTQTHIVPLGNDVRVMYVRLVISRTSVSRIIYIEALPYIDASFPLDVGMAFSRHVARLCSTIRVPF